MIAKLLDQLGQAREGPARRWPWRARSGQETPRFEDLAAVSPVGVFYTDAAGYFLYVNQTWCEMTGMPAKNALGTGWIHSLHPVDRAWLGREWQDFVSNYQPRTWEYRFRQPDGKVVWAIARVLPQKDKLGRIVGFVGAVTDITERRRAEEELGRQAQIIDQIQDAVIVCDADGIIKSWNRGAETLFGYKPVEAVGKHNSFLYAEAAPPAAMGAGVGDGEGEFQYRHKSGHVFDGLLSLSVFPDRAGGEAGTIAVVFDNSARKKLERTLTRVSAEQETILDSARIGISVVRDDVVVKTNGYFKKLFGIEDEGWHESRLEEFFPRDEMYRNDLALARQHMAEGKTIQMEAQIQRPDGSRIWCRFVGAAIGSGTPNEGTVWLSEDISKRKQVEQELRANQNILETLGEASPNGVAMISPEGLILTQNSRAARLIKAANLLAAGDREGAAETLAGKTPVNRLAAVGKNLIDILPADHRGRWQAALNRAARTGQPASFDDSRPDLHTSHEFHPIHDGEGRVAQIAVFSRDITETKRAEAALRQSERTKNALLEASTDDILMVDTRGIIIAANRQAEAALDALASSPVPAAAPAEDEEKGQEKGQEKVKYIGVNLFELYPPVLAERRRMMFEKAVKTRQALRFEDELGDAAFEHSLFPVLDADGEVGHIAAFTRNVTDRAQAEEALRIARDELEARVLERTGELRQSNEALHAEIAERKATELALRASEQRFRLLFETSPQGIAVGRPSGRLLDVNPAYAAMFGYSREELLSMTFIELTPERWWAMEEEKINEVLATNELLEYEKEHIAKDGTVFPVLVQVRPVESPEDGSTLLQAHVQDLTERRRSEDLATRFGRIMENLEEEVYVIDAGTLKFLQVNRGARENLGYSMDELRDMTPLDLGADLTGEEIKAVFQPLIEGTESSVSLNTLHRRKDGSCYDCEIRSELTRDQETPVFVSIARDITERLRAEKALNRLSTEQELILEGVQTGIAFTRDGQIIRCNQYFEQMFGWEAGELPGRSGNLLTVSQAEYQRGRELALASFEKGESHRTEIQGKKKDGTIFWCSAVVTAVDPADPGQGVVWLTEDISERKQAQAELMQASKLASIGEMVSGIAHEVNQPLSVVRMSAQLALMALEEEGPESDTVLKKLQVIDQQSRRMADIFNHLLLFSRSESLDFTAFDAAEAVREPAQLIASHAGSAGVDFSYDLDGATQYVLGHREQIEQVVLNLLSNARDAVLARAQGSGNGSFSPAIRVSVADHPGEDSVTITVADNGGGIPEDARESIFDPFFTTKDRGKGTGLGLSISLAIVRSMGGRLEARKQGDGTAFQISLPAAAKSGQAAGAEAPDNKPSPEQAGLAGQAGLDRLAGRSVLVVDDEEVAGAIVAEYLERLNCIVDCVTDGKSALGKITSRAYDVVITDVRMPEMDGREFVARLHGINPDIPIVALTGLVEREVEEDLLARGVSAYLTKPVNLERLSEVLVSLFP